MPTTYPGLAMGAKRRLEIFRKEALRPGWVRPMTWRDVRFAKLNSRTGWSQGFDGKTQVWYQHHGEPSSYDGFTFADDVAKQEDRYQAIEHSGWYIDDDGVRGLCRGVVWQISRDKYLPGYYLTDNGETVIYGDLFDDRMEAARRADRYAEIYAEAEREHNRMSDSAQDLEETNEDLLKRLRELLILRHKKCMDYVREEIAETISSIRDNYLELTTTYKDYR